MAQSLRVGISLPPNHSDRAERYLGSQPLLPTWDLSVRKFTTDGRHADVDLIITSPRMLDPAGRGTVSVHAPVVLVVERASRDELSALIGTRIVRGLVLADDPPETLALGITAAASYGVWVAQAIWEHLEHGHMPELDAALKHLTAAELETFRLLARGMTNREIAEARHVQPSTVKYHVDNIRLKTGAANRRELLCHAYRFMTSDAS
ncbi:DNA-binding response regulator [Actinobacteria bacterium YIM 96077]|uniref:HTH luxR-type domain-containing protein n=2 Tax=Phytoactinopolyspora halophila TaxID=1981511 RepID=A0A329QVE1_9ACTN|nr:DNA-binding response regulator [Actinobacteria bacterium YIM 96077]RAW15619.1 hypothetical protein DPM12_08190 [Phytoactinopolyspora halophila]